MKSIMALTPRLRQFAGRPLVRNILKVLTGNVGGNVLFMLTMVWIGVALGKDDFGVLGALFTATMLLAAQLADFGLSTAIVKYYLDYAKEGRLDEAEALLRRSLWIRLWIIGAMTAGGIILARPIMTLWLHRPELASLFRLACLGIAGSTVWTFCQSAMQARQQFGLYAALTTANHALRLGLVGVAIALGRLSLTTAMAIMVGVPLLGIVSSFRLWPRRFWTARMEPAALARQFAIVFQFSKWIFISTVITSVIMRVDILLLGWLRSPDLGQYNFAMTLAQGIPLVTAAVSTVLLPKLAATRRRAEIRRLVGMFLKAAPVLLGFVVAVIVAAHLAVPLLRGGEYRPCLPVFDLLVVGSSISIILNPISFFCLALERASWLTWMNLAQLGLTLVLSLMLIPLWGAVGAGVSALLVRVFAVGFMAAVYPRLLKLAE